MQQNDIAYVLNASNTCPKPDFIPESHFLRVPVNDSFCEKILPWLDKSVEFIGQLPGSFFLLLFFLLTTFVFEVCQVRSGLTTISGYKETDTVLKLQGISKSEFHLHLTDLLSF